MRSLKLFLIRALLPCLAVLFAFTGSASAGQRIALVIGNSAYSRIPALPHVRSDKDAVVAVLRDAGFGTIIDKHETSTKDLKNAFERFEGLLNKDGGDEIVIYFSGYGIALGGANYLLPVDVPGEGEEAIRNAAVSLKEALAEYQKAKPRLVLVLMDASRPNPFKPMVGGTGLAPVTPDERQVFLFSAAPGKTAFDKLGQDDPRLLSLFPRTLQKELLKPGVPLADALRAIQTGIGEQAKAAGLEQTPALYGQAATDLMFRPTPGPAENSARLAAEEERQVWEAIDKQRLDSGYQRFLKGFPDGAQAGRARDRLADLADWALAKSRDLAPLRTYVQKHPAGLFIQDARPWLEEEELWEKARAGADMAPVKDYLARYAQGRHREPAATLLGRLEAEDAARREQSAWDTAFKGRSETSLEAYLKAYPQGRFAQQARELMEQVIWEKTLAARRLDLIGAYLGRYPQGRYATEARNLEEDILWEEVRQCDENDQRTNPFRCDALAETFAGRYAQARHGAEGAARLEALKASRPEREERKALADAEASGQIAPMQAFVDRFPASSHYLKALGKLAALWNAKPLPGAGTPFRDPFADGKGSGPEMVAIKGGRFQMGSTDADAEKPPREVLLPHPIAVGKREVSFDEWDACTADGGCPHRPDDDVSLLVFRWKGRGNLPVINVNWEDVQQYVKWLSAKTGKPYRLLTEAEWEYAARAGTTTRFSFGDDTAKIDEHAWYISNSKKETHPVGSLATNANGLFDMQGNVAEWVADCWHSNYTGAPVNGHVAWTVNCVGEARVSRGGSIFDLTSNLRTSSRGRAGYKMRSPAVGFRVARDYP